MPDFLQYWKTYNPEKEVGTPLDFAASAQFKPVKPGDTLWIVALRQRDVQSSLCSCRDRIHEPDGYHKNTPLRLHLRSLKVRFGEETQMA
jgi:hypothetical protein